MVVAGDTMVDQDIMVMARGPGYSYYNRLRNRHIQQAP